MSKIEVDKLDPQSGTALEIGTSGDTVTVPSGVGLTLTDSTLLLPTTITSTTEVKTNKISPATGVAFALGDSGDTFTVPSGATIVNSGTATGFGITEADQWRMSADLSANADPISANLERVDDGTFAKIGTGMTESTGIWTFGATGLYKVSYFYNINATAGDNAIIYGHATSDYSTGPTWDVTTEALAGCSTGSGGAGNANSAAAEFLINVTDTAEVKVKFSAASIANITILGDTAISETVFTFIRLGGSQ